VARDRKIKSKKVVLASDHAGFKLKEEIKKFYFEKSQKNGLTILENFLKWEL